MKKLTFRSDVKWLGRGLQCEGRCRNFTLRADAKSGGTDSGMDPVEILLTSLSSCLCMLLVAFQHRLKGGRIKGVTVSSEGDVDVDAIMKGLEGQTGVSEMRVKVVLETSAPRENAFEYVNYIRSICPVYNTLTGGTKVEMNMEIIDRR